MKTTIDPFITITDDKLETVSGGTLGGEPGIPDPGNDVPCTGGSVLGNMVCEIRRQIEKLPTR